MLNICFSRFVDTIGGHDTLHDTVGIIYQDVVDNPVSAAAVETQICTTDHGSKKRRRRNYNGDAAYIPHYSKQPMLIETLSPLEDLLKVASCTSQDVFKKIYFAWSTAHFLSIPRVPMWVGFNNLIYEDKSRKQKVSYLTTINQSPTSAAVVRETMIRCKKAAEELGEDYIQVTYDLGIAKIALQIQSTEKPVFDYIFIHLGIFHVLLAYFKAIGKFIDGSGICEALVDAGLLASGSVNGFISGKHFNRCKRLYPLLAVVIQILHFEEYLEKKKITLGEEESNKIKNFLSTRTEKPALDDTKLSKMMDEYEAYENRTLKGKHGKTPQYYMMFVRFVKYSMMLNASVRTGDLELLKLSLSKVVSLFFIFNQQNYARYLTKYLDNLVNVDKTHPGLRMQMEQGTFGIKRTSKSYSRQPVDLTLEQTINADAANKLTGILHY